MDDFKLENFESQHPGQPFPGFVSLSAKETGQLRLSLARKAGLEESCDGVSLLKTLSERSRPVEGVNAESKEFDLFAVVHSLGLKLQPDVYINWDDFTTIDRMRLKDLAEHFSYVWYPGPDDLEIFDDSLSWMLFVDHGGYLALVKLADLTADR